MESTLFDVSTLPWPQAALESIYKLYPRPENRKAAIQRIEEALSRIVSGEIDGAPRTQQEAILYLRERTEAARQEFAGREKRFIPHPTTWYGNRRYLRTRTESIPKNLLVCVDILSCYPFMPDGQKIAADLQAFLPQLSAVEKAVNQVGSEELLKKVCLFAHHVSEWPKDDLRFVPGALRWFSESRFQQDEQQWIRKAENSWEAGRQQIARVFASKQDQA